MLRAESLRKRYGSVVALDGLDLTVPGGTLVGFLGPNGAGKTTAMRVVMGIAVADGGTVTFDGRPADRDARLRFGYMPEERGLYPGMVVREQLVYFARLHGVARDQAVRATADLLERLGLAERAGDKVEALSLGNQQRVQLAAALVSDPVLLVLDEPFSGLDPAGVDALGGVLAERAAAGAGVLFSSHQLDLVEHLCEEVVIVDGGRVVAAGPVELLTTSDRLVEVEVGADPAWAERLDGVRVVGGSGRRVALQLLDGTEPDAVLDAARAAGPVRHFSLGRRRLSEVFREAVA